MRLRPPVVGVIAFALLAGRFTAGPARSSAIPRLAECKPRHHPVIDGTVGDVMAQGWLHDVEFSQSVPAGIIPEHNMT